MGKTRGEKHDDTTASSLKRMRYTESGVEGLVRMQAIVDEASKLILDVLVKGRVPWYCKIPACDLAIDKLDDENAERGTIYDSDRPEANEDV
jgi:hypothetical protein